MSLLERVTHSHEGGELDLWTARGETNSEFSDDETQEARKMFMRFSVEGRLMKEELSLFSQNVKAKWDCDETNERHFGEYEESFHYKHVHSKFTARCKLKIRVALRRFVLLKGHQIIDSYLKHIMVTILVLE